MKQYYMYIVVDGATSCENLLLIAMSSFPDRLLSRVLHAHCKNVLMWHLYSCSS